MVLIGCASTGIVTTRSFHNVPGVWGMGVPEHDVQVGHWREGGHTELSVRV